MQNGIDVSSYQGSIDWEKVKAAGIQFAIVRAGYGDIITQKDAFFDANMTNALAAGIAVGAYWFSYAVSTFDAEKEADVFSQVLAPYRGKLIYPAAYDYEYASRDYAFQQGIDMTPAKINDMANAFLTRVQSDGWKAILYTNNDYRRNFFSSKTLKKWPLWLADYAGDPEVSCAIQQTSGSGQVNGISGNVDTDVSYENYGDLSYTCDTSGTVDVSRGKAYQALITSNHSVSIAAGTPDIVTILWRYDDGDKRYFYFVPIGQPGQETGIYINGGPRQFIVKIR